MQGAFPPSPPRWQADSAGRGLALPRAGETRNRLARMSEPLQPLSPDELRHPCSPDSLGFDTTDSLEPLERPLGQDRAVDAFDFGIHVDRSGFNLFAMGQKTVGKRLIAEQLLEPYHGVPAAAQRTADGLAPVAVDGTARSLRGAHSPSPGSFPQVEEWALQMARLSDMPLIFLREDRDDNDPAPAMANEP